MQHILFYTRRNPNLCKPLSRFVSYQIVSVRVRVRVRARVRVRVRACVWCACVCVCVVCACACLSVCVCVCNLASVGWQRLLSTHRRLPQEAAHGLRDVSGMDRVVVRIGVVVPLLNHS